jgi:hypothetical protein
MDLHSFSHETTPLKKTCENVRMQKLKWRFKLNLLQFMALEDLNLFDQILCNEGETLNTIAVIYVKILSNEKRGGLNVQSIGLALSHSR